MKIRAITLFVDLEEYMNSLESIVDNFSKIVNQVSKKLKIEVWTRRLATQRMNINDALVAVKRIKQVSRDKIDYIAAPVYFKTKDNVEKLKNLLKNDSNIYTSLVDYENFEKYIELLELLLHRSDTLPTAKIAFHVGKEIVTPYFPAAVAPEGRIGIAAAILYVDDLIKAIDRKENFEKTIINVYEKTETFLEALSDKLNVENLGVDLSISPWMDESVAKLIEKYSSKKFGSFGTHRIIFEINSIISKISKGRNTTGYNEIMLPYAEDSYLMQLGERKELTLYSLISYAAVCVAGVDMTLIPFSKHFREILLDIYSVLNSKKRPSGIRVIPVKNEEGYIDLGIFGKVPVLQIR